MLSRSARPGSAPGFYKDSVDYNIFCGNGASGRIYETRTALNHMRWFWALHPPSRSMRISNEVATLEVAKSEFEASWKQRKAWAKMEETA